ncbi:hypothetical protein WMY93_023626 [Mugilogobius chulae]|uniref:Uncharacterized protein n=1 Tax=Mugilogobius chulae TaxID=88201 RepID=A0AAW0N9U4_9GOBI
MFAIHVYTSEETESCPPAFPVTRGGLWRLRAWGENEMLQSVEAHSREELEMRQNVSIHANWCGDPPAGCRRLLSEKGIKGPFTTHGHVRILLPGPLLMLENVTKLTYSRNTLQIS